MICRMSEARRTYRGYCLSATQIHLTPVQNSQVAQRPLLPKALPLGYHRIFRRKSHILITATDTILIIPLSEPIAFGRGVLH